MTTYVDANKNNIDTTGASTPQTNAAIAPAFDAGRAPNSNGVTGTPIVDVQISVGGGISYLAAWSNPG